MVKVHSFATSSSASFLDSQVAGNCLNWRGAFGSGPFTCRFLVRVFSMESSTWETSGFSSTSSRESMFKGMSSLKIVLSPLVVVLPRQMKSEEK
eukprot:5828817-Heterocapsa_arctica.AAC.1